MSSGLQPALTPLVRTVKAFFHSDAKFFLKSLGIVVETARLQSALSPPIQGCGRVSIRKQPKIFPAQYHDFRLYVLLCWYARLDMPLIGKICFEKNNLLKE